MKLALPPLLSLIGGYVDTAGFLALDGLFPAHVTGNLVTVGASLIQGTTGVMARLVATPVFCLVVILTRLFCVRLMGGNMRSTRILLMIEIVLLILGAALAIRLGPFPDSDTWTALVTGWVFIASMAVQNVVVRIYMPHAPATNIMTSNTATLMIDLADVLRGDHGPARERAKRFAANVILFIAGCALGGVTYGALDMWCFAGPPVLVLAALGLGAIPAYAAPAMAAGAPSR